MHIVAKKTSAGVIKLWSRLPGEVVCRLRPNWTKPKAISSEFTPDIALSRHRSGLETPKVPSYVNYSMIP